MSYIASPWGDRVRSSGEVRVSRVVGGVTVMEGCAFGNDWLLRLGCISNFLLVGGCICLGRGCVWYFSGELVQFYQSFKSQLRTRQDKMPNNSPNNTSSTSTSPSTNRNTRRMGNRLLNHILPGTETLPYYTCKWCYAEIKNSYFKYLKHRGVCPWMEWANWKKSGATKKGPSQGQNQPKGPSQGHHMFPKEFYLSKHLINNNNIIFYIYVPYTW